MSDTESGRTGRERLANFWNAWFTQKEIARAHAFAQTASEDECQAELERLERERQSRLEAWRWTQ